MKGIKLFTVMLCVFLVSSSAAIAVDAPVFTYDHMSGEVNFDAAGLEINMFILPIMDPGANHFEHVLNPAPELSYWVYDYEATNGNANFFDGTLISGSLGAVNDGPYHIMTVDSDLDAVDFGAIEYGTVSGGAGTVDMTIVPEPASLIVIMTGAGAALLRRRRK